MKIFESAMSTSIEDERVAYNKRYNISKDNPGPGREDLRNPSEEEVDLGHFHLSLS